MPPRPPKSSLRLLRTTTSIYSWEAPVEPTNSPMLISSLQFKKTSFLISSNSQLVSPLSVRKPTLEALSKAPLVSQCTTNRRQVLGSSLQLARPIHLLGSMTSWTCNLTQIWTKMKGREWWLQSNKTRSALAYSMRNRRKSRSWSRRGGLPLRTSSETGATRGSSRLSCGSPSINSRRRTTRPRKGAWKTPPTPGRGLSEMLKYKLPNMWARETCLAWDRVWLHAKMTSLNPPRKVHSEVFLSIYFVH